MTAIVWYRDDLRVSDHPALHAAAKSQRTGCVAFTCSTTERRAFGRSGGAARWWLAQSLRALQASLRERGASLVLRKGPAPEVIAALAREIGAEAVYWNEIAQAPHQAVGRSGCRRAGEHRHRRAPLPRRPAGFAGPDPQQGEPRPARVHAVLAAGAGAGRSAEAAAGAEDAEAAWRTSRATAGGLEARADAAGLGRRPARQLEAGRGLGASRASRRSSTAALPAIPAIATGPTATAPRGSRRIFVSARSVRARSGTPRASPRPSTLACPPISKSSSANSAGASSAVTCCSTCPISPTRNLQPSLRRLSLEARRQGACAPGSAARPAIPSSMPACANSGTPA